MRSKVKCGRVEWVVAGGGGDVLVMWSVVCGVFVLVFEMFCVL